jgi:hypothetical protein
MKWFFVGMACQAITTALLTNIEVINPSPDQQAMAGALFLVLAFGLELVHETTPR